MPRSISKGPFIDAHILEKISKAEEKNSNAPIKIWSRRSTILPQFVGKNFAVHNGKTFVPVIVTEDMIGHKFGEFAPTRRLGGERGDMGKKAKAKRS